jgi:geranylgeranyl pyrophosphate synthase
MVIKVIETGKEKDKTRLLEILSMHTKEKVLIEEAVIIIEKYQAIDYAKEKAQKLVKDAWEKVNNCIDESESKQKLKLFADYLINREI